MKNLPLSLWAFVFLACGAISTSFHFLKQGPHVTEEQCERLQSGMTKEEVSEILGGPPDEPWGTTWYGNQGSSIDVIFKDDGKLWVAIFHAPPTVWERIEVGFRSLQPRNRLMIVETDGAPATRPF